MRPASSFLLAILCSVASAPLAPAQSFPDLSAQDLPAAIHQQEILIEQPATRADATAWWKLARLDQDAARYADAEHAYTHALTLMRNEDRATRANLLDGLGTVYVETGDFARAEPLETEALAIRTSLHDDTGEGRSWMHLAMLALGRHDIATAAHNAQLATDRLVNSTAATPEEQMTALISLSFVRCAQNLCSAAIPLLKKAHHIALASDQAQSFPAAFTDFLLGYANWRNGNLPAAARLMKSGSVGMRTQLGPNHPTYISAMIQYAAFLDQTHHSAEAAALRARLAQPSSPAATMTAALRP